MGDDDNDDGDDGNCFIHPAVCLRDVWFTIVCHTLGLDKNTIFDEQLHEDGSLNEASRRPLDSIRDIFGLSPFHPKFVACPRAIVV